MKPLYTLLFTVLLAGGGIAQTPPRIHLHLGQQTAFTTETLWYAVSLSSLQKARVYVYLLNEQDSVLYKRTLPVTEGKAYHQIRLNGLMATGMYQAVALTDCMNPEEYARANVLLINDEKPSLPTLKKPQVTWQFFPEGGKLINGLNSRVALRVQNENLPIEANLVNQNQEVLATCTVPTSGMSFVSFSPKTNEKYFLKYAQNTIALPQAQDKGYNLRVLNNGEAGLKVLIQRKGIAPSDSLEIVMKLNGEVIGDRKVLMKTDVLSFAIPQAQLSTAGLLTIELYQHEGEAQAYRHTWVSKATAQLKPFVARAKAEAETLNVLLSTTENCRVSVAVIDSAKAIMAPQKTIDNQAFTNDIYWWCKAARSNEANYQPQQGITIKGKFVCEKATAISTLPIQGWIGGRWVNGNTDPNGAFTFATESLYDTASIYLKISPKAKNPNISLVLAEDGPPTPHYQPLNRAEYQFFQQLVQGGALQNRLTRGISLGEVTIKSKKWTVERKELMREFLINNLEVSGEPIYSMTLNESDSRVMLSDILRKKVTGVRTDCYVSSRFSSNGMGFTANSICIGIHPALLYLNGRESNYGFPDMSVENIRKVEVYFADFGQLKQVGVVVVYTKKADYDYSQDKPLPGVFHVRGYGFGIPAVFKASPPNDPEASALVYWTPDIEVSANQTQKITVPISKNKGVYWVNVCVTDTQGNVSNQIINVSN